MNYPNVRPQPMQMNQQQQGIDPVMKILEVLKPLANHVTRPQQQVGNNGFSVPGMDAAMATANRLAPQNSATLDLNSARTGMNNAQNAQGGELDKLISMMTAPRPAMPKQQAAMGGKESLGAALVAALGAGLGARPQYLQQGIQGYTGAREQNAQMQYANQVNDYNAQNDQTDRNIQGQQLRLSRADQKFQIAKQYFDKAGGDLERAKELYRIDNENIRNRKWANEDYDKKVKAEEVKTFWKSEYAGPKKGVAHVESIIARGRQLGLPLSPDQEENLRQEGRQAALTEAMKKAPVSEAAAIKMAPAYHLQEGTPEYDALLETGRTLGALHKNQSDGEYQATLKYLREGYAIRDAASMARVEAQQSGMNTRQDKSIAAGKIGREYTQGEITKRSREGDQRKMLAPYNKMLDQAGFSPLQPVLPGNLPPSGTPVTPTRRDSTTQTKPQTPAKSAAKAATPAPKPRKATVTIENGKKVTTYKY